MSLGDHPSRPSVAEWLKQPTRKHSGQLYRFLFGLASGGVYMCPVCYQPGGELLPRHFTLTCCQAVYFCCTGLGVASTGCYPAPCPVKPGLSSPAALRLSAAAITCPTLARIVSNFKNLVKQMHWLQNNE